MFPTLCVGTSLVQRIVAALLTHLYRASTPSVLPPIRAARAFNLLSSWGPTRNLSASSSLKPHIDWLDRSDAMPLHIPPWRIYRPSKTKDENEMRHSREVVKRGVELLRQSPVPDTFLGRKTQEPFPKDEESESVSQRGMMTER